MVSQGAKRAAFEGEVFPEFTDNTIDIPIQSHCSLPLKWAFPLNHASNIIH
jgi:hypothetical protein